MPSNVQIVIFIVAAVIVVTAILWGKSRVRLRLPGVEASVDPDEKRSVSVLERAQLENVEAGNVTGERRTETSGAAARDVGVLNDGVIRGGKLGDISGVIVEGSGTAPEKK